MTNEEAIKTLHELWRTTNDPWYEKVYEMAINALTAQPETHDERTETLACDCIERQAAIDALEKVAELYPWRVPGDRDSYSQYNEAWQDALNRADSEIEALPSAQPPVLTCDGCRHVGTYDTDFPCSGCIRREKDYYEQER